MPLYDRACADGHQAIDVWEPVHTGSVPCTTCGKPAERVWLSKGSSIVPDDIPGGLWVRHGICNEDGTPRKYYTKSEMVAEAKRRGLVNMVRHVGSNGSDKSQHTTSWTSIPANEEDRLKAWHEHEAKLQEELRAARL